MSVATPDLDEVTDTDQRSDTDTPWQVILHNDPVTPMQLVVRALQQIFGYDRVRCEAIMFEAHTEDRAVVADGTREQTEGWATQLHSYSLWATVRKAP